MFINTTIPPQSEAAFMGEHIRIVGFARKHVPLSPPPPLFIYLFIYLFIALDSTFAKSTLLTRPVSGISYMNAKVGFFWCLELIKLLSIIIIIIIIVIIIMMVMMMMMTTIKIMKMILDIW